MYWSIISQQLIIIIAMSYITITFACFGSTCSCRPRCPCVQQPVHRQQSSYAAPFAPLNKLPGYSAPPPSYSAPYPSYSYNPAKAIPYSQASNLPYNAPQSYPQQSYTPSPPIAPPPIAPPPIAPPPPASYGPEITGNVIPTPEIYNPPGSLPIYEPKKEPSIYEPQTEAPAIYEPQTEVPAIYEPKTEAPPIYEPETEAPPIYEPKTEAPSIYEPKTEAPPIYEPKKEAPSIYEPKTEAPSIYEPKTEAPPIYEPKTEVPPIYEPKTEVPPIYESQVEVTPAYESRRDANEYGENFQQTEVTPSPINSEYIDDVRQYADDNTDTTLLSQNVAIVPTTTQTPGIVDDSVTLESQIFTTQTYPDNAYEKRYRNALLAKRRAFDNQNLLRRQFGKSRKRYQEWLPCIESIGNYNQMLTSISNRRKSIKDCITLLNLIESNEDLKSINPNPSRVNNKPNVRSNIRPISRMGAVKNLKSAPTLITDNRAIITMQGNRDNIINHDNKKFAQKHQNPDIAENMSRERNFNLIGIGKYDSQDMEAMTEKGTIKRTSSMGSWTIRSDKLLPRRVGGTARLNSEKENEDRNYYTTYYQQTCIGDVLGYLQNGSLMSVTLKCDELDCDAANVRLSGNRIREIVFLKNISGRFKNYGSYCISRKPIIHTKSGHVLFGAKRLPRNFRFYNESAQKLPYVKLTVINCKDNAIRCRTNSLRKLRKH